MSCARFLDEGERWRSGTLDPERADGLAAHLRACPACARSWDRADLRCRASIEFLADYLEDVLAPAQRARFEAHLEGCEPCRRYLDSYRDAISLARGAHVGRAPPMPEELVRAILATLDG